MSVLFDVGERTCVCCKKREAEYWSKMCMSCAKSTRSNALLICTQCGERPRRKSGVKQCQVCFDNWIANGDTKALGKLDAEWRRRVNGSMSSLRQRSKALGQTEFATGSDVAQLIMDQDYRCRITGVRLEPDATSELAHIVPRSKGGCSLAENLMWVTKTANRLMNQLTLSELRTFARQVVIADDAEQSRVVE